MTPVSLWILLGGASKMMVVLLENKANCISFIHSKDLSDQRSRFSGKIISTECCTNIIPVQFLKLPPPIGRNSPQAQSLNTIAVIHITCVSNRGMNGLNTIISLSVTTLEMELHTWRREAKFVSHDI
jgi:hypothetical protein